MSIDVTDTKQNYGHKRWDNILKRLTL